MPGYVIHLTEANMILQQMPDWYSALCSEMNLNLSWKNEYLCGSVLPDAVPYSEKEHTHFWDKGDMDKVLITPHLQRFMSQHKRNLLDPLVLGYLAHLHLDLVFFRDYFPRYIRFVNADGADTLTEKNIHHVELVLQPQQISLSQLFSDRFLYGDYTKLNTLLIQKYGLPDMLCPERKDNPFEMNLANSVAIVKKELHRYLEESHTVTGEPRILEYAPLEAFMRQAAIWFWKFVEQNLKI